MIKMANVNKVMYGTEVLIDLTSDTVTASALQAGYTAHSKSGEKITGTATICDFSKDTAAAENVAKGYICHTKNGQVITGTAEVIVSGTKLIMPLGFVTVQ